jgi:hypothetical protein
VIIAMQDRIGKLNPYIGNVCLTWEKGFFIFEIDGGRKCEK